MERFKRMAQAAREFQTAEEQQMKFNAALGVSGGTGLRASDFLTADEVAAKKNGMTRQQKAGAVNLARQGADVFTQLFSGAGFGTIAAQQGPQILDALATSGFKASASMVAVGAAVVATAGGLIALTAAQASYESSTLKLETVARGLGAAAGVSADQLMAQAKAGAEAGDISVRAARDIAAAFASTGRIGSGVMSDLIGLNQRYALTTSQDAAGATKELGAAFADPVKGAAELNSKLHFLNAAEQEHIENLARSGDLTGAQTELLDKLRGALVNATDATTGWDHALQALGRTASNVWDAVGRAVDRAVTGGDDAQRLTDLRAMIGKERRKLGGGSEHLINEAQKEIDGIYQRYAADMDRQRTAALSEQSTDRKALIDKYNPNAVKLNDLKADRQNLLRLGVNDPASKAALKELDDQIKALSAGYKTAAAQAAALSKAQRAAAAAARKDAREDAKEAREQAEIERRNEDLKTQALRSQLEIAKVSNDPSAIDYAERQLRIQELITQGMRDRQPWAVALAKAEAQVAAEMVAQASALRRMYSDAELAKDQFLTSAQRMSLAEPGEGFIPYNAKTAFLEDLRVSTGQSFHDGLVAGFTEGDFLDVFTSRLKYAAATALADSLTNSAFGKKDGGGGFFSKLASLGVSLLTGGGGGNGDALAAAANVLAGNNAKLVAAGYAKGTDSALEGYAWVGEDGPELRKLRAGDQIKSHTASMAMVQAANDRSMAASGPVNISATYAPVLTVGAGADAEAVGRLEARMDAMQAGFRENVIGTVNDGMARRQIVPGL
ncbi:phage tail length tape measure family protein [Caulobacter sp. UNC279MFTsu5.1]|uniref:phage tail length tape measure family protein n=1 Tax=Caulobacter sp. UNC279MFTsu5.1 TaxID=1502775 RepID=UPI0015A5C182|nr:phage tail length tape measure family protein [Caulobacter sp. UNC279MFTsu5.1]